MNDIWYNIMGLLNEVGKMRLGISSSWLYNIFLKQESRYNVTYESLMSLDLIHFTISGDINELKLPPNITKIILTLPKVLLLKTFYVRPSNVKKLDVISDHHNYDKKIIINNPSLRLPNDFVIRIPGLKSVRYIAGQNNINNNNLKLWYYDDLNFNSLKFHRNNTSVAIRRTNNEVIPLCKILVHIPIDGCSYSYPKWYKLYDVTTLYVPKREEKNIVIIYDPSLIVCWYKGDFKKFDCEGYPIFV